MKYVDAEGVFWDVNPTSGIPSAALYNVVSYYANAGCTGVRHLIVGPFPFLPPRVPFFDPETNQYRVYADTAAQVMAATCSYRFSGGSVGTCSNFDPCDTNLAVPLTSTRAVMLPSVPGAPPYHPVL